MNRICLVLPLILIIKTAFILRSCNAFTDTIAKARKLPLQPGLQLRASISRDAANSTQDRRSVLRKGSINALIIATIASPSISEAKQPPTSSQKRIVNFPRVYPGLSIGNMSTGNVCEIFVDFACPYSRKIFATLSALQLQPKYTEKMAFVYHNVIQPWHHQSLWLHESAFAVKILYPEYEAVFWKALFDDAPRWYDKEVYDWTRGEFYNRISFFAAKVIVKEETINNNNSNLDANVLQKQFLQYLIPPKQPGGDFPHEARILLGSEPQDDENALFPLTKQVVKFQRKRGVHVTPTCFFNGIEQGQISSGWNTAEWTGFLNQALAS